MQCTVDPARQTILVITFNITRHEHGVAWHGERAQHEKGHLHQQPSSEPLSQSGPVILNMEVASRTSPSKSDTAIILLFLFFYSSPYRVGHEYGPLELSPVCQ